MPEFILKASHKSLPGDSGSTPWRHPQCRAVKYSVGTFRFPHNLRSDNVLRFSREQVALRLREFAVQKSAESQAESANFVGVSRKAFSK